MNEYQTTGHEIEYTPRKFKQILKLPVRNFSEANRLLPQVKALMQRLDLVLVRDFRVTSVRGDQLYMTVEIEESIEETGVESMILLIYNAEKEHIYDSVRR